MVSEVERCDQEQRGTYAVLVEVAEPTVVTEGEALVRALGLGLLEDILGELGDLVDVLLGGHLFEVPDLGAEQAHGLLGDLLVVVLL